MRIAFDGRVLSKPGSGIVNYSKQFIAHMIKRHPENEYIVYVHKSTGIPPNIADLYLKDKIKIKTINWPKPLWRTILFTNILDNDKIDVFHSTAYIVPYTPNWIRKVKIIHTSHGINPTDTWNNLMDRIYWVPNLWLEAKLSDHIIAMSQDCKNDIVNHYKVPSDKISIGYFGLNSKLRPYSKKEKKEAMKRLKAKHHLPSEFILYVGGMLKNKNVNTIVKAMEIINHEESIRLPLVILRTTIDYLKPMVSPFYMLINKEVIPLEWIDQDELVDFYNCAVFTIYPSTWEGLGYPISESLACKTPVIASNIPAFNEAGGKGIMPVNDFTNPNAWAIAIKDLYLNKHLQKKLAKEGYKHIKKFNWDKVTDDATESYKKALGQR